MELLLGPIAGWLIQAGPWIVFLVAMAETAVFLGLLVPAEATVLLAAFLADQGYFSVFHVFLAAALGGFTGDQIGYGLGRWGGVRFARQGEAIEETRERYQGMTARLLRRHSLLGISLARFLSFIRTLMPWFAGKNRVPYGRFLLFDALGVIGWAAGSVALGVAADRSWRVVAGAVGTAGGVVLAALVATGLALAWRQGRLRFPGIRRRVLGPDASAGAGAGAALSVGLTGNIASGKSTVARLWREQGAHLVDADVLARRAVEPGTRAYGEVAAAFGPGVLAADGTLDRAALRERVFRDAAARARLEAIVHPEVARLREEEEARILAANAGGRTPVILHDIPLLFEAGLQDAFDVLVLVDAPEEQRLRRLVGNRGLSEEEARQMIAAQMPAEEKRAGADWVIENDGTLAELELQARKAWEWIEERVP